LASKALCSLSCRLVRLEYFFSPLGRTPAHISTKPGTTGVAPSSLRYGSGAPAATYTYRSDICTGRYHLCTWCASRGSGIRGSSFRNDGHENEQTHGSFTEALATTKRKFAVGANADASCKTVARSRLPGVRLVAVATRNKHGAWQEAEAFGAHRWLSDPYARVDEIDTRRYTVAPDIQTLFHWQ
jgi:hypothetical protein